MTVAVFCLVSVLGDSGWSGLGFDLERFQGFPGKGLDFPADGLHGNFAGGLGGFWDVFRDWGVCQGDWVDSRSFTTASVGGAEGI